LTDLATPAARGFRMPAEWEPHRGTWLSWPHKQASWPGNFAPIPPIVARMVGHLAVGEEVHINVAGEAMEHEARFVLSDAHVDTRNVFFHHHPTDDAWCRDHGPIFVQNDTTEAQLVLDWGFNAWGGKYPPFDQDDIIPTRVASAFDLPVEYPGMILEGGSIDVNGRGSLLTTEACLLNPNRNPELSKAEIETRLRDYLGVTNVLWLGDGIVGDDTDGHIDDLTRFVNPDTVVTVVERDPADDNYRLLQDNLLRLQRMRGQGGDALRVIELPMPPALHFDGQRLPASYANFYIGNRVVLLPGYDRETDRQASDVLAPLFPTRKVVTIDCREMVWGLGAFHCLTQQWPRVPD
jgi:agmatine deiminase